MIAHMGRTRLCRGQTWKRDFSLHSVSFGAILILCQKHRSLFLKLINLNSSVSKGKDTVLLLKMHPCILKHGMVDDI